MTFVILRFRFGTDNNSPSLFTFAACSFGAKLWRARSHPVLILLTGLRFTNCKSGKDRTGMSATLEQVQILSREFDLAEHEYQRAIDVMRR